MAGIGRRLADNEPRRGLAVERRVRPERAASTDFSSSSAIVDGHDLRDFDAERRPDFVVAQVEQPRSRTRRPQVQHGDDLAGLHAAETADDPRSRTSTAGGRIADDLRASAGTFRNSSGTRMLRSTT